MFSIDFPEIVIIFGIALVVLGPKKLPGAAAQIGRWVGRARSMARQFREQLEQEVNTVESSLDLKKAMESPTAERTPARPAAEDEASEHATGAEHAAGTEGAAQAGHVAQAQHAAGPEHAVADQAATDEPNMDQWPESAGGWSPDSLIAASMPNSEPGVAESAAGPAATASPATASPPGAEPEPEPTHPSAHVCISAGGRR